MDQEWKPNSRNIRTVIVKTKGRAPLKPIDIYGFVYIIVWFDFNFTVRINFTEWKL